MRLPPAVRVTLQPSRRAVAWVVGMALCTCGVVATLPIDPVIVGLVVIAILVWAGDRVVVVALRRGPRASVALWLTGDRTIVVRRGDGRLVAGHVRSSSYVGARITTLVWRPDGAWGSRAELILPDMLQPDDFRQLRVLLRYGRSEAAHGAPASQA
jgi:toxin CptA